jgi:hypothetical protein
MKLSKTIPAFPVLDIGKAVNFYESRFKFTCRHQEPGFAIMTRDDAELHLWASADNTWKWRRFFPFIRLIRSGAESFLAGTHSCRIQVEGIDALFEELKSSEVLYSLQTTIAATPWRTREFPALDLHRNLLTFYERIQ